MAMVGTHRFADTASMLC